MSPPCALILAGGLGTRLRPLAPDTPKGLVPLRGRPVVEWQMLRLARQGIRRFVLALGYRADRFQAYFGAGERWGWEITCVVERELLGTGGALRNAAAELPWLGESPFAVLNGDTYLEPPMDALFALNRLRGDLATIGLVEVPDASAFGSVRYEGERVLAFEEKRPEARPGWINAGIYIVSPPLIARIPAGRPVSLEREVLPEALAAGAPLGAVPIDTPFFDMGTPDGFAALDRFLASAHA